MPPFLTDKRFLAAACVLAVCLSLIAMVIGRRPTPLAIDTNLHKTTGRVMAEETLKSLGNSAQFVVVVPVCNGTRLRAVEMQVEAFEDVLKQLGKGRIMATEKITAPSPRTVDVFTADNYFRLAQQYPAAQAIVCFAGIKPFSENELAQAAGKLPICVLSMSSPVQQDLIDKGIVRLALMQRAWASNTSTDAPPYQPDGFNNYYVIVKP